MLCLQDAISSCGQSLRRLTSLFNPWMPRSPRLLTRWRSAWPFRSARAIRPPIPVIRIMASDGGVRMRRHGRRSLSVAMSDACVAAIHWYQRVISPCFPARCKYYPTCSAYAVTAVERFGVMRGVALAVSRLLRCQPWNDGGIDDVPATFSLFYRFTWSKAHEACEADSHAGSSADSDNLESDMTASTNTSTGKETVA